MTRRQAAPVAGLVLAAGAGRRLGGVPKAALRLSDGRTLAAHAAEVLLAGGCAEVWVVLGADPEAELRPDPRRGGGVAAGSWPVHRVVNPDWASGMGSSLRAGLSALPEEASAAVVSLVDTPGVTPGAVRRLIDAHRAGGAELAAACYHGRRGHPVLFGAPHWAGVAASARGDAGARGYLSAHAADLRLVECADVADGEDVDTPEAWRRWSSGAARPGAAVRARPAGQESPAGRARPVVVVAPDKFKGSLDAAEAAGRIAAGLRRAAPPGTEVRTFPVADGGEGTVAAALAAGYRPVEAVVEGPTGELVRAALAVDDATGTAVVEIAQAAGLARLPGGRPAPLDASSYGAGQLIRHAAGPLGCRRIVLGLGGSACTDGGAGLLQALGLRPLDAAGAELPRGGGALAEIRGIDPASLSAPAQALRGAELVLASDVDNPLLGPRGAAAVYGPQKGAGPAEVARLERGLAAWADAVAAATGRDLRETPGAGAAGGIGFGALALLGARTRPGIALLLDLLGFDRAAAGADLVVTGEGCLDAQTLHGKAPAGVAAAASRAGARVAAVAGRVELTDRHLRDAGFLRAYALSALAGPGEDPFADAARLAERAGERIAADLLPPADGIGI